MHVVHGGATVSRREGREAKRGSGAGCILGRCHDRLIPRGALESGLQWSIGRDRPSSSCASQQSPHAGRERRVGTARGSYRVEGS